MSDRPPVPAPYRVAALQMVSTPDRITAACHSLLRIRLPQLARI